MTSPDSTPPPAGNQGRAQESSGEDDTRSVVVASAPTDDIERIARALERIADALRADDVSTSDVSTSGHLRSGFTEALRADDVSTLDRMMSAVEDYFPDLLSFPEEAT